MTKGEKKKFIEEISDGLKNYMLAHLDSVPDQWDGHELRHWFADRARSQYAYLNLTGARLREYKNDLLVKNL